MQTPPMKNSVSTDTYVPICLNAKIPKVAFILVMCVVGKMIATLEMMNTYVP